MREATWPVTSATQLLWTIREGWNSMSDEETAAPTKSIEPVHLILMTRFSRSRNDVMAVFPHMLAECARASPTLSALTFPFSANGFRHLDQDWRDGGRGVN